MKINQHTNVIKDIMHFPAISVSVRDSIRAVELVLTLHDINVLPVLVKEEPVGLITRKIVEKAIHHKLEDDFVEEYMIRRFSVAKPDEFLISVVPIIIEERQRLIPVVDLANKLVGVVSRDDILQAIQANEPGKIKPILDQGASRGRKNIKSLLKERLGQELLSILELSLIHI